MKKQLFFIGTFLSVGFLSAATLVIEGKFQNKNIFVNNGYGILGVGFCTKEIKVNGQITTDETNQTSFEIDLRGLQFKFGEELIIEIEHSDDCLPKVLNAEDLKPKPTYEMLMMNVTPEGLFKWSTKEETGSLPFVIEQYKWNKWVQIGEVQGVGTPDNHEYSFKVAMHSGENKYRVKQKGSNYTVRTSKEITGVSHLNRPSFAIPIDYSSIDFSAETSYEVYDIYGQIVKKGFGKQINIDNLKTGDYYLCYDNEVTEFKKQPLEPVKSKKRPL